MSIAASEEGLTPDEAEESTEQLPAAVTAQSEADAELGAMLLRAPKSNRLVVRKAPSPEPSQPLCPQNAATWRNRPRLPSKACKLSSALPAKAYSAAGQAASALHAMDILQVLQAQALKQLHEGRPDKGLMQELRMATDFTLRATKVTARSLGQVMAACGDYGSSGEGRNQPAEMKLGFYSPYFTVPKKNNDPQRCSVVVVVSFLQEKLEQRLSPSTLKIYVAAIAAYYDTVDGLPLGRHHLIVRFLR
ncbi:hypothetical protein M9458_051372, partial [Cirrhinus mrigala]